MEQEYPVTYHNSLAAPPIIFSIQQCVHNHGSRIPEKGQDDTGGQPGEEQLSRWTEIECFLLPRGFGSR